MTITSPSRPTSAAPTDGVSFASLGVPGPIVSALSRRGIDAPFPVQAMTLPDALAGRDLCGRAPTGSGKTLAFGIPLVARVRDARPGHPRGLVLVPTRELASQVTEELRSLAGRDGAVVHAFFGGIGFGAQVSALRRGVDIAVACPGRLADLVQQGLVHLDEVELVVLDEADRMADMGFLPEVKRLLDRTPDTRQTLLFSATLDGDVDVLTKRYQRNPARHEVARDPDEVDRAEHHFIAVDRAERVARTAELVSSHGPTVVFTRTKHGADRVARQLGRAGVQASVVHGNRSQGQRERALAEFHSGASDALVATDVAARGIHVDDVACVIHFDPPEDPKDYVHRSGRTARAGSSGVVVTMVSPEVASKVKVLQRSLGFPVGTGDAPVAPDSPVVRSRPKPRPAEDGARNGGSGGRSGPGSRNRSGGRSGGRQGARRGDRSRGGAAGDRRSESGEGHRSEGSRAGGPRRGSDGSAREGGRARREGGAEGGGSDRQRGSKPGRSAKGGRPGSGSSGRGRASAGRPSAGRPSAGRSRSGGGSGHSRGNGRGSTAGTSGGSGRR